MQPGRPLSREEQRRRRVAAVEQAWRDHYYDLVNGEVTLAEILKHTDQKLMQIADKGLRMLKVGKYDVARKILSGLPLLDPYVPYFHLLLAAVHEKLGEQDNALAEYDQVIELCESMDPPGSLLPCGMLSKAKLLARVQALDEAMAVVRELVSEDFPVPDQRIQREARVMLQWLEPQIGAASATG